VTAKKAPPGASWTPAPYGDADVTAVKALARDPTHKRALDWIIHQAAATYDLSFRPGTDGERETAFAEGRRFVGLTIVKLINTPAEQLLRKKSNARPGTRDPSAELAKPNTDSGG
jgi:hypothetical protein